jgi:membrane fusion protein, copper/silver efflux system
MKTKSGKKFISGKLVQYLLLVIVGIFIGWLFFHSGSKVENKKEVTTQNNKTTMWTCSMHPQIRMAEPGKCPLCGMELIPLIQITTPVDSGSVQLTKDAVELANIMTTVATRQPSLKEIRLYGKVAVDERLLQSQVAHFPGRIEKLMVNFNGEGVSKGQTLALVYSPELVTAQQELIEAAKSKQAQPDIYEASKEKLRQWKLTENQITSIEQSGKVQENINVESNTNGIVTAIRVKNGDYISVGTVLFDVADLSRVWLMFDAYESDLEFLNKGDNLTYTFQALPGKSFTGNIAFIDPVIDPVTRVARVRVEANNEDARLKPEMFATGTISARLTGYRNNLVIPKSAVLWTGKRSVVYVKQTGTDEPVFKIREVELGPMLGNSYVIINGLMAGEEIVTEGAFSIDAAAQLEGKPSMMSEGGGRVRLEGMDMPDESAKSSEGAKTISNQELVSAILRVSGNCEMCKDRIEKSAKSVKGVTKAVWSIETKQLRVTFDKTLTSQHVINRKLADVGHDNEEFRADDKVYAALPECCLYRK